MPKLPGRESTKLKIPIERLAIAGFFMPWESNYEKFECVVAGCDHVVGKCFLISGDHQSPGMAVDQEQYQRDAEQGTRKARTGPACSCCTTRLLASER